MREAFKLVNFQKGDWFFQLVFSRPLSVPLPHQRPPPAFPTWYLLVELKGISTILAYRSLISFTEPQHSSIHFKSADSEASPATARCEERQHLLITPKALHPGTTVKQKKWNVFQARPKSERVGEGQQRWEGQDSLSPTALQMHTHTSSLPALPVPLLQTGFW